MSESRTLLAFTGKMGAGKSEAINMLKTFAVTREVILIKLASPLYDMQEYIYNRVSSVYKRPNSFTKDRNLLQWLGTEWGRNTIGKDLWVDLWAADVNKVFNSLPNAIVVCDDCRFDNEAEIIQKIGGKLIKISTDSSSTRIDTSLSSHISEAGVSDKYIYAEIENNSSLENYKNKLTYLFTELGLHK